MALKIVPLVSGILAYKCKPVAETWINLFLEIFGNSCLLQKYV